MKKLSLALLALFLFTPIYIEAKKKPFGNGLYWDLDKYGNLEISGVGDMMNFSNSNPAPWHNKNCWYVTICEGVTSIGDYAFDGNLLTKVLLPSTIQRIGRNAFYNSDINEIVLPESIVELNEYAFHKCQKLQKVVLSENLKVIPEYAFWDCDIREIQIPQSIISIGEGCFASNNNLKRVVLENENTELHKYAFGHSNETNRIQIMRRNRVQNCYWVEEGDKVGILTFNSKWIIPINNQYTEVQILNSEYIKVKNNENYGIISMGGRKMFSFPLFPIHPFPILRYPASGGLHGFSVVKFPGSYSDIQLNDPFFHLEFETELSLCITDVVQTLVYHDEHGRDECHVQYDLDAVFACREEVREAEVLFQETIENLNVPAPAVGLRYLLCSELQLVRLVGDVGDEPHLALHLLPVAALGRLPRRVCWLLEAGLHHAELLCVLVLAVLVQMHYHVVYKLQLTEVSVRILRHEAPDDLHLPVGVDATDEHRVVLVEFLVVLQCLQPAVEHIEVVVLLVLLYEGENHFRHGFVLVQVGRLGEHLRQFRCKAVVGHCVFYLVAVILPLGLTPHGEALLELVASLGHHRAVHANEVHLSYLLVGVEGRQLVVEQLVSLFEEVKVNRGQPGGDGTAGDLHVHGVVEECLERLAGKNRLQLALAQTVCA